MDQKRPFLARSIVAVGVLLAIIAAGQWWIVSAGTWTHWPRYTALYSELTGGFLHGQTSLLVKPSRQLLALSNPYDHWAAAPYKIMDAVLYHGEYYLYWGPTPAVLAAGVCLMLGIWHPQFGDQYLVFAFLLGTVLLTAVLLSDVRCRLFPQLGPWAIAAPLLSLGLGAPVLYTLARPAIYEAAIAGGQFFLMGGFLAAWLALRRRHGGLFGVAGLSWALAAGARISLWPAVAALAIITGCHAWRTCKSAMPLAGLGVPLLAGVILSGEYNHVRFQSATNFGWHDQLGLVDQHSGNRVWFTPANIPANIYIYLMTPPTLLSGFPFLMAETHRPWFADILHVPKTFVTEAVVGLNFSQPFLIFALLGFLCPGHRPAADSMAGWLVTGLCAAVALSLAPVLWFSACEMRYLLDGVPLLSVLGALGYWRLLSASPRPGGIRLLAAAMVLVQTAIGVLLGLTGCFDHFAVFNPRLFNAMASVFGGVGHF